MIKHFNGPPKHLQGPRTELISVSSLIGLGPVEALSWCEEFRGSQTQQFSGFFLRVGEINPSTFVVSFFFFGRKPFN